MPSLFPVKIVEAGTQIYGRATGGTVSTLIDKNKNLEIDIVKDKLIKVFINEIEYVRKIISNTADTITLKDIVKKVAASAVIEKKDGGKVTITAIPEGAYANQYQVAIYKGGAGAETEADFADDVLNIILGTDEGTAATAEIGTGDNGVITITCKETGDLDYTVEVIPISDGTPNMPMTAIVFSGEALIVTLGTDENGNLDDTKNTAALIEATINNGATTKDIFTATASGDGSGVFSEAIEERPFTGGIDSAITATASEVAAVIEALEDFSAVATTEGVLEVIEPVKFTGGIDEVKPMDKTEYYILL